MATANINAANAAQGGDEKVSIGHLTYVISSADMSIINEKIGKVLEAQIILRGSSDLGVGYVTFKTEEEAAAEGAQEGISGAVRVGRGDKRGRGREKTRGARRARSGTGGRVRRSADDVDVLGEDAPAGGAPTSEAAQNGQAGFKAAVDGVALTSEEAAKRGGRGQKGTRGKGATPKSPRVKKERGEPSKTLVFIRNLPYTFSQDALTTLFNQHGLSFTSLSIPVWKYGPHKGQGRGYAFANVENEDVQNKAIEALNGIEIAASPSTLTAGAAGGDGNPTEADEGAAATAEQKEPRKFKIVVRQGFEGQDSPEKEAEAQESAVAEAEMAVDKNGAA